MLLPTRRTQLPMHRLPPGILPRRLLPSRTGIQVLRSRAAAASSEGSPMGRSVKSHELSHSSLCSRSSCFYLSCHVPKPRAMYYLCCCPLACQQITVGVTVVDAMTVVVAIRSACRVPKPSHSPRSSEVSSSVDIRRSVSQCLCHFSILS